VTPPPSASIEIVTPPPKGQIRHALFDFDGTISLLREGWQQVMAPMMLDMICGASNPTPEIEQRVADFIDETTGIQTIVQMEGLVDLVREFGNVDEEQILDPAGYKAIYNDRLMERVNVRRKDVQSGALSIEDATVRGVREFIQSLSEQGVTLYIFSGTDREDVQHEAALLGVADYFAEITGAIGSYAAYNKERVIKELMAEHQLSGPEVLVVGDGPVEIRHGAALGCVTVGVASDELNRQGWDDAKRDRLTKAGAHVLVPEFSQPALLFESLALKR
jgi:phosphoglycolate phosphatase-like HAD superfamily hydrolase